MDGGAGQSDTEHRPVVTCCNISRMICLANIHINLLGIDYVVAALRVMLQCCA